MIDRRLDSLRAQMRNDKEPLEHAIVESEQKYAASCRAQHKEEDKPMEVHTVIIHPGY